MKLALFDLDYTLLPLDSDHAWGEFTTRIGWTEGEAFRQKNEAFYAQYKAGTLDIHEYVRFSTAAVRRQGPEAAARAHAQFMREVIAPAIRPQALALIEQHRRAGEAVAIVTATNEFITRPIAHALGVDELIAINLERGPGGWFTGEIAGTPSFREGKITRVGQWLAARGLGWADADATFYKCSAPWPPTPMRACAPSRWSAAGPCWSCLERSHDSRTARQTHGPPQKPLWQARGNRPGHAPH